MEGREWLVVPMIMLTEGVHNGSSGPGLYEGAEIGKILLSWNHKPVVVYHPTQNGQSISACDPIVLTSRKIGVIMNTKYEDGKLKAEAWLDPDRMALVDDRILAAIESNTMMELSTGLFTDKVDESGVWNGEKYTWKAVNFVPDHLAVLPDMKGACSIPDGAGFLRMNSDKTGLERFKVDRKGLLMLVENEMGHDSIRQTIGSLLRVVKGAAWVEEVYDSFFIYELEGKLYRYSYSVDGEKLTLTGEPEEVVRVTEYRTINGMFVGNEENENEKKGSRMDMKETVQALIDNEKTHWTEEDKDGLMAMPETTLKALEDQAAEVKVETPVEKPVVPKAVTPKEEASPVENKAKTTEEFIKEAPEGIREVLTNSMAVMQNEKSKLIAIITANKRNTFTEDMLASKSLEELSAIATLATEAEVEKPPTANYIGQGPVQSISANTEEPLSLPILNFELV